MRVLTPGFVNHFAGRLVNIHPSLLPAFGLHTHAQALATAHGCTVHFVTPVLDHGPIIAQGCVVAGDTPDSLANRVLEVEHRAFPAAVRWLAEGRVTLTPDHRVDAGRSRAPVHLVAGRLTARHHPAVRPAIAFTRADRCRLIWNTP